MNNAEENYSDDDRQNIQNIHDLLAAEESQNFDAIYSYFSPSMEQYWDISYPTREELETRYNDTWQKSSDAKHYNTEIEKINEKMYVLKGTFQYFSFKKQQTKTLPIRTFFQFDENGKIVITKDYR
jgi:ABC-type molybdate transport system substrate-binding protein